MTINFAHIRERSTNGGWINFAVFEAKASSGTTQGNAEVLARLTNKARLAGLKIDQSALVYSENSMIKYYGTPNLVKYLSRSGVPCWTNTIED